MEKRIRRPMPSVQIALRGIQLKMTVICKITVDKQAEVCIMISVWQVSQLSSQARNKLHKPRLTSGRSKTKPNGCFSSESCYLDVNAISRIHSKFFASVRF